MLLTCGTAQGGGRPAGQMNLLMPGSKQTFAHSGGCVSHHLLRGPCPSPQASARAPGTGLGARASGGSKQGSLGCPSLAPKGQAGAARSPFSTVPRGAGAAFSRDTSASCPALLKVSQGHLCWPLPLPYPCYGRGDWNSSWPGVWGSPASLEAGDTFLVRGCRRESLLDGQWQGLEFSEAVNMDSDPLKSA